MVFRFTLTNADKGALVLSKDPRGWKDIEAIIKRGLEYHGTFYETMVQLEFTCGSGKEYIDEIYDEYGVDAVINIVIEINCASSGGIVESNDYSDDYSDDYGSYIQGSDAAVYSTLFEGTLDLSKYNKDTRTTFVDLLQSDFIQKILNRFETKVELTRNTSLDNVALTALAGFPSTTTMHSKELLLTTEWENIDDSGNLALAFPLDAVNIEIPMINITDDIGGAQEVTSPYIFTFLGGGSASGYENTSPFFTNTTSLPITFDLTYNIQGTLSIRNSYASTVNYYLYLQTYGVQFAYVPSPPFIQNINAIVIDANVTENIAVSASGTAPITLASGESMFLTFGLSDVVGNVSIPSNFEFLSFIPTTFVFEMTQESVTASTTGQVFKIHETGAAIAQRITSQEDAFRSTLLGRKNSHPNAYDSNGCASFTGMMNGKHVRGFPVSQAPFFMSMKDFYKTVDAIWNCGLGFEKSGDDYLLRLEKKEYFYDTDVILQCPNANNIKTSVAKEYYTSSILLGYDKWEVENTNGLDEFNTKREYDTGIKAINNKRDLVAPMIASMYSIEFARRQGVSTEDYKYDNDNFIVCLNRSVDGDGVPNNLEVCEKDENFATTNNFRSPETAYNIRISPLRNLLSHMNVIASSITKYAGRAVKFVYGEGNFLAETEFSSDTCPNNYDNNLLIENQDVTVVQADATPIWIPEYVEFDYPLAFNDYLDIKENTFKCIEVSNSDTDFIKGFIIEIRYKPVGGMAYFKLLKAYTA